MSTPRFLISDHVHGTEQKKDNKDSLNFSPDRPFEYVGMDILAHVLKTRLNNQFVMVMTDRYTKGTKSVPTRKTNAKAVTCIILEQWVVNFRIRSKLLTDNGPQFVSNIFAVGSSQLGAKNNTNTECHSHANSKAKQSNLILVSPLRSYVSKLQTDYVT